MSMPAPDGTPGMGDVDPEVVKAAEAAASDGYAYLTCKAHGVHAVSMNDIEFYAEQFIERASEITEDTCPLSLHDNHEDEENTA